jgi:hypothetical protein
MANFQPPRPRAVRRYCLMTAAVLAIVALTITTLKPPATAQPNNEDPPLITRTYDLAGLVGEVPWGHLPELALEDYWSSPWPNHDWGPGVHQGGWSMDELDEFSDLLSLVSSALGRARDTTSWDLVGPLMVEVEANERFHELLGDCLKMLRALNETTLHFEVMRLEDKPERAVLDATEAAELEGQLVGRQSVRNSGVGILSQVSQRSITTHIQYRYQEHSPVAEVSPLYWGEQWIFGGIILPDGSVRVQGAHLHAAEPTIRDMRTHAGNVQLPRVPYSITPGSATLKPGGGLVFDTNQGVHLLRVVPSGAIPNITSGGVTIQNPGAWYVPGHMRQIWMLESSASGEWDRVLPRAEHPSFVEHEVLFGCAENLYTVLTEFNPSDTSVATHHWGPLVLTKREELDPDDLEKVSSRAALDELYAAGSVGPDGQELRISVVQVPSDTELPEGFVRGTPAPAEIAALLADPATTIVFDRGAVLVKGQQADLLSAEIENFLVDAERHTHPESKAVHWSMDVASHARGTQVRVSLGADGETYVQAAWRPISTLRTHRGTTGDRDYEKQAPEGTTVSMLIDAVLPKGGSKCVIQPAPDNTRAILLVQRKGGE